LAGDLFLRVSEYFYLQYVIIFGDSKIPVFWDVTPCGLVETLASSIKLHGVASKKTVVLILTRENLRSHIRGVLTNVMEKRSS
jgi:hypothetical protein